MGEHRPPTFTTLEAYEAYMTTRSAVLDTIKMGHRWLVVPPSPSLSNALGWEFKRIYPQMRASLEAPSPLYNLLRRR